MGMGKGTPQVAPAPEPAAMPFTPEGEQKAPSKRAVTQGQKQNNRSGLTGTILTSPLGVLGDKLGFRL